MKKPMLKDILKVMYEMKKLIFAPYEEYYSFII